MQVVSMREKMFTMRWSEEEAASAELVAQRYGMTVAGLVRMLIQREMKAGAEASTDRDPFASKSADRIETLVDVLSCIAGLVALSPIDEPAHQDLIASAMASGEARSQTFYGGNWKGWKTFPGTLNALRRAGYITKRGGGYQLTIKGAKTLKSHE